MAFKQYLILICSIAFRCIFSKKFIPVLFWSDQSDLQMFEDVPAGHNMNLHDFNHIYISKLIKSHPSVIMVFIQNKLSLEDLVQHGKVYGTYTNESLFHNLQNYISSDFLLLPAVAHPSNSLIYLKSLIKGQSYNLDDNQRASELNLDSKHSNLIIIRLNNKIHNNINMAENDARIGQIMKDIQGRTSHYIAFLTADNPSKIPGENNELHKGRHLLEETTSTINTYRFFVNTSCILMAAENITVSVFEGNVLKQYPLPQTSDIKIDTSETFCSNSTPKLVVKFSNFHANFTSLKLSFFFNTSVTLRYWEFIGISVEFERQDKEMIETDLSYPTQKFSRGFSYHCSRSPPFQEFNSTKSLEPLNLTILEFQIQPLDVKNNQFSDWDDCEEFFSIAIWMGLFVTSILLIILFCGVIMVMSIKTMDRFDDPKRKTISVTNTE